MHISILRNDSDYFNYDNSLFHVDSVAYFMALILGILCPHAVLCVHVTNWHSSVIHWELKKEKKSAFALKSTRYF